MLVTCRSFAEYAAMFDLDGCELDGLVVDCCAGASSFVAALAEMLRVTRREVRVFPLVVQRTAEPVPFLGQLVDELRTGGCQVTLRDVAYEFQRGARTMLVMSHQR